MEYNNKYIEDKRFIAWVLRPTADLNSYWSDFLKNHPEEKDDLDDAKQLIKSLKSRQKQLSSEEKELFLEDFKNRLHLGGRKARTQRLFYQFGKIAAAIALFLVAFFVVKHYQDGWNNKQTELAHSETIIKSNPAGIKSLITLPDGSTVKLNSESQIVFNSSFLDERKVALSGEAYFDVVTNPDKPFIVESGGIDVKVLGTSFNVQAFSKSEEIEVALVEGRVEIHENEGESQHFVQALNPGEMFVYHVKTKVKETRNYDPKTTIGWKDGELNFNNLKFKEVVQLLERWYGVEIEVRNMKAKGSVYEGYYKNEQLNTVLEGLSFVDDFEYEIIGKKVIIK